MEKPRFILPTLLPATPFFRQKASSMLDGLANDALVSQVEEAKFRVLAGETWNHRKPDGGKKTPRLFFCACGFLSGFFLLKKHALEIRSSS